MTIILIYAAILLALYFMVWMPQRRRAKEQSTMLSSLGVGDEVVLNAGIHGFVTDIEDTVIWLEVAEGVELKVSRDAIAANLTAAAAAAAPTGDD